MGDTRRPGGDTRKSEINKYGVIRWRSGGYKEIQGKYKEIHKRYNKVGERYRNIPKRYNKIQIERGSFGEISYIL